MLAQILRSRAGWPPSVLKKIAPLSQACTYSHPYYVTGQADPCEPETWEFPKIPYFNNFIFIFLKLNVPFSYRPSPSLSKS